MDRTDARPPFSDAALSRTLARMVETADDSELMLRYAQGEARAFEALYERHKGALYRYLLRLCRDRNSVDDLFQDVWDHVIRSRKRYQPRAKFATFLYRIAHNCAIDYFRRKTRRCESQSESMDERAYLLSAPDCSRPERQAASEQLRATFQEALDRLPEEQRAAFVLYEESGLSLEEIADITGVGVETAKSRLRYAVAKLRKALGSADDYFGDDTDVRDTPAMPRAVDE